MTTLDQAFERCEGIAHKRAGHFRHAFRLIAADLRRDLCVAYAYLRAVDGIADSAGEVSSRIARLDQFRDRLRACFTTAPATAGAARTAEGEDREGRGGAPFEALTAAGDIDSVDPIGRGECLGRVTDLDATFVALADVIARRGLVQEELAAVIQGARRDLTQRRYATYADLAGYCDEVAGSVGLVVVRILGCHEAQAMPLARDLGTAMQLTNILRNVRRDFSRDRLYLPLEDLARFGVSEDTIGRGAASDPFAQLVRFEADRARGLLDGGRRLEIHLASGGAGRGAAVPRAVVLIYGAILKRICEDPGRVLVERVSLGTAEKSKLAARALVGWGTA